MSDDSEQRVQVFESIEQDTIDFYGHPIVTVTLEDGRNGVVLKWMCDGLELVSDPQVRRIKRSPVMKDELVPVRVNTDGGRQEMPTLLINAVAYWLSTIDPLRVAEGPKRENIILFQRECMGTLYAHFANKSAVKRAVVPADPMPQPIEPAPGSAHDVWIAYHQQMISWHEWQKDMEAWREHTDASVIDLQQRMDRQEELTRFVPELLTHYRMRPLSDEHQATAQALAKRLHETSGKSLQAIWSDLNASFHVANYDRIPDARWSEVFAWFKTRIAKVGDRTDDLYDQRSLF
jgi:hypothetical protein